MVEVTLRSKEIGSSSGGAGVCLELPLGGLRPLFANFTSNFKTPFSITEHFWWKNNALHVEPVSAWMATVSAT